MAHVIFWWKETGGIDFDEFQVNYFVQSEGNNSWVRSELEPNWWFCHV